MNLRTYIAILLCAVALSAAGALLAPRSAEQIKAQRTITRSQAATPNTNRVPFIIASKISNGFQTNFWGILWASNVAALTIINLTNSPAAPAATHIRLSVPETRAALASDTIPGAPHSILIPGTWTGELPMNSPSQFIQVALANQSSALAWTAPPSFPVIGYKVYCGQSVGAYDRVTDVGLVTEWSATELTPGATYYFVVTAYDASGTESEPSNGASYTVPIVEPRTTVIPSP